MGEYWTGYITFIKCFNNFLFCDSIIIIDNFLRPFYQCKYYYSFYNRKTSKIGQIGLSNRLNLIKSSKIRIYPKNLKNR